MAPELGMVRSGTQDLLEHVTPDRPFHNFELQKLENCERAGRAESCDIKSQGNRNTLSIMAVQGFAESRKSC